MKITARCRYSYMLLRAFHASGACIKAHCCDSRSCVVSDPTRMDPRAHGCLWSDKLKPRVGELIMQKQINKVQLVALIWAVAFMLKGSPERLGDAGGE